MRDRQPNLIFYCIVPLLAVSACVSHDYSNTSTAPPAAPAVAASTNALTALAGTAQIGPAFPLTDPVTGDAATVRFLRRYDSGAGHSCADYRVTTKDSLIRSGLACQIDGVWQDVPPLISTADSQPTAAPSSIPTAGHP